jgi:hypothetical protein
VHRLETDYTFLYTALPLLDIQHLPRRHWMSEQYDLRSLVPGQLVQVLLDGTSRLGAVTGVKELGQTKRNDEGFDVTVICPYYRNGAITIHDASGKRDILPYYIPDRPVRDLLAARRFLAGTLHVTHR